MGDEMSADKKLFSITGEELSLTADMKLVNLRLVELVEDLLARVKTGDITMLACAYVTVNRSVGYDWSTGDDVWTLVGSVARMQHDLLTRKVERD